MIKLNCTNNLLEINKAEYQTKFDNIYSGIINRTSEGSDFLGWIDFIANFDESLIVDIEDRVKKMQAQAKVMIVIGIGGSYLGSLAVQQALNNQGLNDEFKILYIGNNISSDYVAEIYEYCKNNDFVINVISKSGNTLEPALGFRIFKELLVEKYGTAAINERVIVTTDKERGALKKYCNENNLDSYVIEDDIGGRFSVFSGVGLVPLAFVNTDLRSFIKGAQDALNKYLVNDINNDAFTYALNRYAQYTSGKSVEALVVYEEGLRNVVEWWKQLFGESEGKDGKGLFPTGLVNSSDLHSLGQFVQDGSKIMFETVIKINNAKNKVTIPLDTKNLDNLNDVCKHDLHSINKIALEGVVNAHVNEGNVPNLVIEMDCIDEYHIGEFMMFMMVSCTYSAYLLEVNPFNQPGVEVYKKEVFKLL